LEILIDSISPRIAGTRRGSDGTCVPRRACANEGFGSAAWCRVWSRMSSLCHSCCRDHCRSGKGLELCLLVKHGEASSTTH